MKAEVTRNNRYGSYLQRIKHEQQVLTKTMEVKNYKDTIRYFEIKLKRQVEMMDKSEMD